MNEIWSRVSSQLKHQYQGFVFETYVKPLTLVDYLPDEQRIVLATPHTDQLAELNRSVKRAILGQLKWLCSETVQVSYLTNDEWHQRSC